jgi:SWI/SNF-related matrix-associated actin-dependent regulator of chromatin subfamily A member 5
MEQELHGLRQKAVVSYAESENSGSPASARSSFAESPSSATSDHQIDISSEDELGSGDMIHVVSKPAMSTAVATRHLPSRSTRSQVSYASPKRVLKKVKTTTRSKKKHLLSSDTSKPAVDKVRSARALLRKEIEDHTKPKRDTFLLVHADLFLPLLPENNYIRKLQRNLADDQEVNMIPHEMLEAQPDGVKATMKPYQLEGLSFLLHMYNNGMSAILGDEMGLGKTLQTLSLFQHLNNTAPAPVAGETRPYLVVCPLSVLSSWINETTRWTPGLKVMRFHGPKNERERLKREAVGLEDRFGQKTTKGKSKSRQKVSKVASGMIDLDSEEEPETEGDRLVDVVVTTYETFVSEQSWFKRTFVW